MSAHGIGRFYAGYEPLERIKGIDSFDSLLGRTLENQKEATAKRNDDDRRDDRHIYLALPLIPTSFAVAALPTSNVPLLLSLVKGGEVSSPLALLHRFYLVTYTSFNLFIDNGQP